MFLMQDLKSVIRLFSVDSVVCPRKKRQNKTFWTKRKMMMRLEGENRTEGNLSFPTIGDELDNKTKNKQFFIESGKKKTNKNNLMQLNKKVTFSA
jgi:hypothetical protein